MPTLLSRLPSTANVLSHGPTPATVFTASPIAPGGFVLTRIDGEPLRTADRKAADRARELTAALSHPSATLVFNAGAYLQAVTTRSTTPAEHVKFRRDTSRVHVPGPRGGSKGRWESRDVWSADTLTVTTTPFDYRAKVTHTRHFQPCDPPAADDHRHPDNIRARAREAAMALALHHASLAEARRASRRSRQRYAEVPGSAQ